MVRQVCCFKNREESITLLIPRMNKIFILIVILAFTGCEHIPIEYTYKTDCRNPVLTKADIAANPNIGVAVLSAGDARDTYYVERGIYDFVYFKAKGKLYPELLYTNIGSQIELNGDRKIANPENILRKCPGMRYALYICEGEPHISKYKFNESVTASIDGNGKEQKVNRRGYRTTISINAEMILFDLVDRLILARATKKFQGSKDNVIDKSGPDDNIISSSLNTLRVISDLSSNDSERYPQISLNVVEWEFKDYTYFYLKKLSKQ